jgi:hypothetical protein
MRTRRGERCYGSRLAAFRTRFSFNAAMDSGTVDEFRAPSGLAVGVPALLVVLFRDLQDRRVAL